MSTDAGRDHAHHHHGAGADRRRLLVAFGTSAVVLVAQAVGTVLTGSLALLADTVHMLTDVAGLGLALTAATLVMRPATTRRTWGLRRAEVLAALAQSAALLAVGVYVVVDGLRRLADPPDVPAAELAVFGAIGLVGNLVALGVLAGRRDASLNLRAAFLEVVNDALGSVGVIVAAIVVQTTGWQRADVVAALLIGVLIVPRAIRILREATNVLLESTPAGLDLGAVRAHLLEIEHVEDVHDLHASLIASGLPVLSAHVVVRAECFHDGHAPRLLDDLQACVAGHFDVAIEHSTFQLEPVGHVDHEHPSHD